MITTASLENLQHIRQYIEETAKAIGASREAIDDLVLAVDEAVTNIIIHGYGDDAHQDLTNSSTNGRVEIQVSACQEKVIVTLRDNAPPFDPTAVPKPNLELPLEKRPIGGLGVFLIRSSVDEFQYRRLPQGGNELILIKRKSDA
jgi:anti-sigma regulatory factor (Ser/Thr protein kinase)